MSSEVFTQEKSTDSPINLVSRSSQGARRMGPSIGLFKVPQIGLTRQDSIDDMTEAEDYIKKEVKRRSSKRFEPVEPSKSKDRNEKEIEKVKREKEYKDYQASRNGAAAKKSADPKDFSPVKAPRKSSDQKDIASNQSGRSKSRSQHTTQPSSTAEISITREQLSKHNTRKDCWTCINGIVYDITEFINEHPGGSSIMKIAGQDGT